MARFVVGDVGLVLEGQPDVVQPFQQTMAGEGIDLEGGGQPLFTLNSLLLEINRELVPVLLLRPFHNLAHFFFRQYHSEKTILQAVIGKNIGKRGRDHRSETEIGQRPYRVLARRAAAKVLACYQNTDSLISRLVQHESRIFSALLIVAPVIKEEFSEAGTLDALEKLFRDDLVRIHVVPVERSHQAFMYAKWLH